MQYSRPGRRSRTTAPRTGACCAPGRATTRTSSRDSRSASSAPASLIYLRTSYYWLLRFVLYKYFTLLKKLGVCKKTKLFTVRSTNSDECLRHCTGGLLLSTCDNIVIAWQFNVTLIYITINMKKYINIILYNTQTLSEIVSQENLDQGSLYPPLADIQECSIKIAKKIVEHAYETGMLCYLLIVYYCKIGLYVV